MAKHIVLIAGVSASGKSASLRNLKNQERVFYLNTEMKPLPFSNKFKTLKNGLENPMDIFPLFQQLEEKEDIDIIVIDSLTFLMDKFEDKYISGNRGSGSSVYDSWIQYNQFFKNLVQGVIPKSSKTWIILAHNREELTNSGNYKYFVPIKGSLKNTGIEAYFTTVIYTRRIPIDELKQFTYDENYLQITPRDEAVGYKHCFQCEPTRDIADCRIRSNIGCFNEKQVFINNDCQLLLDHLDKYYGLN